ncbi:MAG: shikimate dehydrogenase [Edaphocola sp.]
MYGIIGLPLEQSFSPGYFTAKFRQMGLDETYLRFPLTSIQELPKLLMDYPRLRGLNVTMPYKQEIIPYLHELDQTAKAIGAVNTIHIKNGLLTGYNTDTIGFSNSLAGLMQPHHQKALVLGTGGAAKAVWHSLSQLGMPFLKVSRSREKGMCTYGQLTGELMASHAVIINATPLGMLHDADSCPPIPYQFVTDKHLAYDLIYTPEETLFMRKAAAMGALVKNGYDMLIGQAEAAWQIWNP